MSRVLLFGASGFLGGQIREVLARDERVERLSSPGRDQLDLVGCTVEELTRLLLRVKATAVVNCTGRLDGTGSELMQANALVTAKLVDALSSIDATVRFVRIGSAGEYGPVRDGHAVTEADPARPVSAYGVSHLAGTGLVELAAAAGRIDGVTLRVFNPIGPGMGEQNLLGRAVARLRDAVARGTGEITLGPLSAHRDFVDARDVAVAVSAALTAPDLSARVINVGSGRAVPARRAVSLLAQEAGFTGDIREEGAAPTRSATVGWMLADISRAAGVLGWRPTHELADSAKAIWADAVRGVPA